MRQGVTKEKVILSFLEIAAQKGTGGASLSDIASALSIKKSSLYNHFDSRADLVRETTRYCDALLQTVQFRAPAQQQSESLASLFESALNRYFKMFESYPLREIFIYLESGKYYSPEIVRIASSHQERVASEFANLLRAAVNDAFITMPTIERIDVISKTAALIIRDSLSKHILLPQKEPIALSLIINLLQPYIR